MSSDESYASPSPQRRRKRKVWPSSSEESVDAGSPIIRPRRCRRQQTFNPIPDEDSSDSDGSIIQVKRKKVARVRSDSEQSSSSDSVIFNIKKNVAPIEDSDDNYISDSQWETDFTDNETQNKINIEKPSSSVADEKVIDSDSSDGQSEKCPICLASFRLQKIGVPESCDHSFCLECIQEWSKNMNTCPVDRKEYNSISIKKSIEGVVLRKVAVDKPQTQNEVDIVEDLTYCEICGSSDNEERLLLCDDCHLFFHLGCVPGSTQTTHWKCNLCLDEWGDLSGCDFGFHMYCLTPALQEVPAGRWYCNGCSPLMNPGQRRAPQARLPRTTQIERVRRRIANNRRPTDVNESRPSTSSGRSRSSRNLTASTSRPRKSTKKRRRTKISYRTVYEIDEVTGEAVAVKKRVKAKKKNTRRKRKPKQTQGSKKSRGGCRPGTSSSNVIEHHRHNAGIPSLDLFGTANRLDYFSESEEDYNNTAEHGILITLAAGFRSEASRLRRVARRKALMVDGPSAAVSSSSDILGSIMDTQEKFLAKNSVLTVVDSSGKLDIQQKNQCNAVTSTSLPIQAIHEENNNNKVDINSSDAPVRETPYGGRRGGNPNRNRYSNRGGGYNNSTSHNNYNRRYDNAPSHSSNSGGGPLDFSRDNFDDNMGGFGRGRPLLRDGDFNMPQDYTQRTLERENFNRPPRRDERDDRNFFPRFPPRDDFRMPLDGDGDGPGFPPRDNFRMPLDRDRDGPGFPPRDNFRMPLDRDRDGPGFPPRFHDDFPRNRRGNRGRDNSMYSPPRHENSFKRNEDYTPGPPNFPRDPPADFSTGPPNFAPEHPIDFTPGPEPDFSSAPPTNFGHERGGPEPLPALGAIRPEIPSLLELGPPPSLGFGPPPLLGLRLPPILDSGPPPVESSTFPTGPPPGFAENFPRPLLGSPPVEPSTFPAGPPPGFAENFPRPLLGSPPVEPSTFPAGPPPGFAENFPRPLLGSPPVEPSTFPVGPPPGFAENFPRPLLGSPPVEPSTFPGGPPPGFTENFPPPLLGLPPVEPPTFPAGLPPGFIENFPPPLLGLKLPSNLESAPSTQTFSSEPDFSFSHVENSEPDFTSDSPPRQFTTNLQSDSTAGQFNVGASFQSDSTPAEFNLGADFQSESTADQFNVVGANFQSDSTTGQANHDADFQSDSSPGQFKSGGDFQSDSTPCELNDSNLQNAAEDIPLPETYMPEEAYMPESDEVPQSQDDSVRYSPKDDSEEYNPENCTDQYNPEDYPDEYNPEECTQGSDPEVDIYGDMGEEAAKTVDNSEGNMLPPPEPPMSLLGDHRPLTPSSVPYTPSRPLSPGSYSPKRPYSPPRSYSPSFPTSPPRSLPNDVPYTPSRPFTPNRTPERPNNATAQVDSPAGNTDGDSENDMVIDTDKGQEEQKDDSTPNISNENPIASQENQENIQSQEDISTDAQVPENVNEGETEKNDETWEKDSDNGDSKLGENMWEETPSVHKKPQSNNWEETPVPRINNNWEETPALRVKPPPKSNWDREEDELGDGCPNFSIYSRQSKSVALTTDITISQTKESIKNWDSHTPPKKSSSKVETTFGYGSDPRVKILTNTRILSGLYSDSEDESVVKKTSILDKPKDGEPDNHMTEEIVSEEERSYTPCRDENSAKQGLEGLDTEMVSEDERNEFENGTADGDALEINAKDTELDFTRPEDCEEGEIPDTNGGKSQDIQEEVAASKEKIKKKKKEKTKDVSNEKEKSNKENVPKEFFKKISRSNKDRNYRGDRGRSRSPRSKEKRKTSKEKWRENKKKKDKRREIERYDVRAIISEKPDRPKKDGFGRDIPGNSRSRSYTPPLVKSLFVRRSVTPKRRTRSPSPRRRPNRERSRSRQKSGGRKIDKSKPSRSKLSRSKSRSRKKDKSKTKKRKRSASKSEKRREGKGKKRVRARSQTPLSPQQQQPIAPRDWTPSLSPSPAPMRIASPSWTPPREETRLEDLRNAVNQSLQVLLNNTTSGGKSKRDKRRKEKRRDRTSRRRRERTPPPSKEVFASGDNILVSVSFNNENESRDVREKRREEQRKKKNKRKDKNKEIAGVKPVAIIDLERSPFMEVPSSPKEIIVLSDSDQQDAEASNIETACDSSQQVASPETRNVYSMGPKTPPEPQVKFSLSTKPSQLRVINNPLHDPDDEIQTEPQEEVNTSIHKGPNTPPEPPTSPPSSPDAYDPFEPTKSRSPSPQPSQTIQSNVVDESNTTNVDSSSIDIAEKINQTPEVMKPSTPPISEVQPADSQCSIVVASELKSPDTRLISNVVSQVVQATVTSVKPVAQTIPFSSVPTSSMITSTPIQSTITTQRINILNSTVITPQIPQRIVLPNQVKSSPVKISPTKAAIKSTPIKPMAKAGKITKKVSRVLNGSSTDEVTVDVDSPYSPASSDYEDLFEPPPEILKAPKSTSKIQQSHKSVFDTLFGSPSMRKKIKPGSAKKSSSKTKHIGVKIDEDSLKILEDLPNSAVEMQVKDKFLKKLNRQERVVEEVKMVLKPFYNRKKITKDEYKDIMRRAVPKICHNKSGEINPNKIRKLVEAYVKKISHSKKVTSSSSLLPLLK